MAKDFRQLDRIVRGFANHRRIEMLHVVASSDGMDLGALASACGVNLKTASEHARRLNLAGLLVKHYKGRRVLHTLSPRARKVLAFLRTLE